MTRCWSMGALCYLQCVHWSCGKNVFEKTHSFLHTISFYGRFFLETTTDLVCDGVCHLIHYSKKHTQWRESLIFLYTTKCTIHTSLTECALVASSTVTRIAVHSISTDCSILTWVTGTLVRVWKKYVWYCRTLVWRKACKTKITFIYYYFDSYIT